MKLISHEARKSPNGERKAGHTGRNASCSGPRARNSVKPCAPSLCGGSEIGVGPDGGAGKEGRVTTMTRKAAVALKPAATSNPVRTSACISNAVRRAHLPVRRHKMFAAIPYAVPIVPVGEL